MIYPEQKREIINGIAFDYLCHIQEVSGPGIVYPAHFHSYIELLYGISGEYDVLINSICYPLKKGDMVLINSKEVHQISSACPSRGQYIVLRFEPELIYNSMFHNYLEIKYVLPFIMESSSHKKVIKNKEITSTFIPELLYEILKEFETKSYGYELAIKNHIGRIFLWILRYFHTTGTDLSINSMTFENQIKLLQPAMDYVLEHYKEDISAWDMAALCNLSYSYFSRTFNKIMKMNFHEYVNHIRIMEAEKLLLSSDMNITEISTAVGFNTTSYFIKIFKIYKNISPKQFKVSGTMNK